MDGEIQVESQPGLGSRFWFDLTFPNVDNAPNLSSVSGNRQAAVQFDAAVEPYNCMISSVKGMTCQNILDECGFF